jgi:gas vesicle protein
MSRIFGFLSGVVVGAVGTNWFYTQGGQKLQQKKEKLKDKAEAVQEKIQDMSDDAKLSGVGLARSLKFKGEEARHDLKQKA